MSDGLDLAAIRARADLAAFGWGGEWCVETERASLHEEWSTVHADGKRDMVGTEDPDVAAHIAGMDPATTLALVDELEQLRAKIAAVEKVRARWVELCGANRSGDEYTIGYYEGMGDAAADIRNEALPKEVAR